MHFFRKWPEADRLVWGATADKQTQACNPMSKAETH